MSVGEQVARAAAAVPHVEAVAATFARVEDGRAVLIDSTGEVVYASKATSDWPAPADVVWLLTVDGQRLMLGAPAASPWGTVATVGTDTGTVQVEHPAGSGRLLTYALPRDATAEVGDMVRVDHARALVLAVWPTASDPTPIPTPGDGPRETVEREAEVNAAWDGTAQPNGFWIPGSKLYTRNRSGGPNYATIGYGDGVTRLGIDPASVLSAAVYLSLSARGSTHSGGTHTLSGRSGVPTPANVFEVAPTNGWLEVPIEAARALVDGDASGLTFYGGTGTVLHAAAANPGNGRLRVRYRVEA